MGQLGQHSPHSPSGLHHEHRDGSDLHTDHPHDHQWFATDGTGLHAPPGEIVRDHDTGEVCCHVCGEYFRALGSHVRSHGYSAAEYRRVMGLCRTKPLTSPDVSAAISERQRHRFASSDEHRRLLATGQQMARDGRLSELARTTGQRGRQSIAVRDAALATGRETRSKRRAAALASRLDDLGVDDLDEWLRHEYRRGASLDDLADMLRVGQQRLRQQLRIAGVEIRPTGINTIDAKRSRARTNDDRAADRVGTDDIGAWLRDRRNTGHSLTELSHRVGHSTHWVRCRLDSDEPVTLATGRSPHTTR